MKINSKELKAFRSLVVELNMQWQMLDDLFLDPQHEITFRDSAPNFWKHLKFNLSDLIILSISRFFDPSKTQGKENLSLESLVQLFEFSSIQSELKEKLDNLKAKWTRGAKKWRNKKLGHFDKPTTLGSEQLPEVSFRELRELIDGINKILNFIDNNLNDAGCDYKVHFNCWVPNLIECLNAGIEKRLTDRKKFMR